MGQEQAVVEWQYVIREPTTAFKIYVLFLVIVCVVVVAKLIRLWIVVPPF